MKLSLIGYFTLMSLSAFAGNNDNSYFDLYEIKMCARQVVGNFTTYSKEECEHSTHIALENGYSEQEIKKAMEDGYDYDPDEMSTFERLMKEVRSKK